MCLRQCATTAAVLDNAVEWALGADLRYFRKAPKENFLRRVK